MSKEITITIEDENYSELEALAEDKSIAGVTDIIMKAVKTAPKLGKARHHLIEEAVSEIYSRIQKTSLTIENFDDVETYLSLKLNDRQREVFGVLFLDADKCIIKDDEMFRGTIDRTGVYPREVVKSALEYNASGAIFYQNRLKELERDSQNDIKLAEKLSKALAFVNVESFDHITIGKGKEGLISLAKQGDLDMFDRRRVER